MEVAFHALQTLINEAKREKRGLFQFPQPVAPTKEISENTACYYACFIGGLAGLVC
jgi:hypothetical protein